MTWGCPLASTHIVPMGTHISTYMYTYMYTQRHRNTHMHIYTYTYAHIYTHTHTLSHIHIYIHIYTYIHSHIHTHSCTHTHIHTHTYSHIITHTCTHSYTYLYTFTYMHNHTYSYMFTYTYTYSQICMCSYMYICVGSHTYDVGSQRGDDIIECAYGGLASLESALDLRQIAEKWWVKFRVWRTGKPVPPARSSWGSPFFLREAGLYSSQDFTWLAVVYYIVKANLFPLKSTLPNVHLKTCMFYTLFLK